MIKIKASVTKPVTKPSVIVTKPKKGGRPRVHASDAERAAAYRKRIRMRGKDVTDFLVGALGMGS